MSRWMCAFLPERLLTRVAPPRTHRPYRDKQGRWRLSYPLSTLSIEQGTIVHARLGRDIRGACPTCLPQIDLSQSISLKPRSGNRSIPRALLKCSAVREWLVCRVHGAGGGHAAGPAQPQWKQAGQSQQIIELTQLGTLLHKLAC